MKREKTKRREYVAPEFRLPKRSRPVVKSRRHDISPGDTVTVKVGIYIKLDRDILEFFKNRAAEPGSPAYQTQINNELRKAMETAEAPENMNTVTVLRQAQGLIERAVRRVQGKRGGRALTQ
jgi:uncharacterized protein (DUF4415 family)